MKLSEILRKVEDCLLEKEKDPVLYSERDGFWSPCVCCGGDLHIQVNRYGTVRFQCQCCKETTILEELDLKPDDPYTGMTPWAVEVYRLVELGKERCYFRRDRYGQCWAEISTDDENPGERLLVSGEKFKAWLNSEFWNIQEATPSGRSLTAAQRILAGQAHKTETTNEPPHRLLWAVEMFAEKHGSWTGAVSELFGCLAPAGTNPPPGDDWPATPRGLTAMLKACSMQLESVGVEVKFGKRQPGIGRRSVTVRKLTTFTRPSHSATNGSTGVKSGV